MNQDLANKGSDTYRQPDPPWTPSLFIYLHPVIKCDKMCPVIRNRKKETEPRTYQINS